jgi:hypothetical protein
MTRAQLSATDHYRPGRRFISFPTAAELRYGAIRRGWGEARMLKLDSKIQRAEVVHTGPERRRPARRQTRDRHSGHRHPPHA